MPAIPRSSAARYRSACASPHVSKEYVTELSVLSYLVLDPVNTVTYFRFVLASGRSLAAYGPAPKGEAKAQRVMSLRAPRLPLRGPRAVSPLVPTAAYSGNRTLRYFCSSAFDPRRSPPESSADPPAAACRPGRP